MADNGDDPVTVIEGTITDDAEREDVAAIRAAIQSRGFNVDIDREEGSITVHRDPDRKQARQELAEKARSAKQGDGDYEPLDADEEDSDSSERSDEDDAPEKADTEQDLTKRERRIQRLRDGIEEGEAYTSTELAAIAYDKDVGDVTLSDRAYISGLRSSGDIDLNDMSDPNGHGNAKLYYRGERPDVEVLDEQDDQEEQDSDMADCRYCGKEYTRRGVRRHESVCDENPDVETAWTVKRVETVMHGQGWMTTEEIAQDVLDKETVSYSERDRFHNLLHRKPDLKARITSRPDPDDQRRNQYRLVDSGDTDTEDDSTDSTSECGCPTNEAGEVQHTGDCLRSAEQEIEEMQDLYKDDEPDLPDPDPEPAISDTEDEANQQEVLEEIGPCNIGKIMVEGEFDRYVCQECHKTFYDEADADAHADEHKHLWFKAFDQVPDKPKQPAGFVGGGSAR